MKYKKYNLIITISLLGVISLALLGLDFVPGDSLEISYDFCKQSRMVTRLSPGNRMFEVVKKGGECFQEVAVSPIYFDVRAPQVFERATLEVVYQTPDNEVLGFGPQTKQGEWLWLIKNTKPSTVKEGWQDGVLDFDLRDVYQGSPVMRWIISAPTLEKNNQTIKIANIKITFEKEPLSISNLLKQVKGYLKKTSLFISQN